MYFLFIFILLLALFFFLFSHKRKKQICRKLCCMTICEKYELLNRIIEPFGYSYNAKQDIFSTTTDAWQRKFGYRESYNRYAPRFNMVFDNEPIYFNYNKRTWLIEFWKGQYGINTGGEVGIYYSDSIVAPEKRDSTLFNCAEASDMLPINIQLLKNDCTVGILEKRHWWLTIFDMGSYCEPDMLSMNIGITFPNADMMRSFITAMLKKGYRMNDFCIRGLRVNFLYNSGSACSLPLRRLLACRFAQWKNRIFCRLYLWITKPFCSSCDRVLCLYYYIPFAFRRMFTVRRYKKCKRRRD